jgi:1-acyl-sn-glycerol-3-phosphate acyltransferase
MADEQTTQATETAETAESERADTRAPTHTAERSVGQKILYTVVRAIVVSAWARLWFRGLKVVHPERVPADGAYVVAPVHRSNIDFLLVGAITRRRLRYMTKDSVWKVRPLGWLVDALGGFPVKRGTADREALRTCVQIIEAGDPLVMFPEGTRQTGPKVVDVFDGPAYVAARMGVPLLPVGVGGSEAAMPKGAKWIKPRRIVLTVGEPIHPPVRDDGARVKRGTVRAMTDQLRDEVQSLFDEAQHLAG